jgi:hypothetical protein
MKEEVLRDKIDKHLELIKFSSQAMHEASERATAFLVMVAILANEKRATEEDKIRLSTLVSASYAQAFARSQSKQVTEKKAEAENDNSYSAVREGLEQAEAKISWLRTYIEIFNNAHLTYRQLSRE